MRVRVLEVRWTGRIASAFTQAQGAAQHLCDASYALSSAVEAVDAAASEAQRQVDWEFEQLEARLRERRDQLRVSWNGCGARVCVY